MDDTWCEQLFGVLLSEYEKIITIWDEELGFLEGPLSQSIWSILSKLFINLQMFNSLKKLSIKLKSKFPKKKSSYLGPFVFVLNPR